MSTHHQSRCAYAAQKRQDGIKWTTAMLKSTGHVEHPCQCAYLHCGNKWGGWVNQSMWKHLVIATRSVINWQTIKPVKIILPAVVEGEEDGAFLTNENWNAFLVNQACLKPNSFAFCILKTPKGWSPGCCYCSNVSWRKARQTAGSLSVYDFFTLELSRPVHRKTLIILNKRSSHMVSNMYMKKGQYKTTQTKTWG